MSIVCVLRKANLIGVTMVASMFLSWLPCFFLPAPSLLHVDLLSHNITLASVRIGLRTVGLQYIYLA